MTNIYTSMMHCVQVESVGIPGYHKVALSIDPYGGRKSEVILEGTYSRFKQGKQYLVTITEL